MSNHGFVVFLLGGLGGIGLLIWASVKRLRDIERSLWWGVILLIPLLIGVIGSISGSPAPDSKLDVVVKGGVYLYMVVYILYIGALLFIPSKATRVIKTKEINAPGPLLESREAHSATTSAESNLDVEDRAFAQAADELANNQQNAAIWARAFADAEGDESKAKALYIRYRVQRITK